MGWEFYFIQWMVKEEEKLACKIVTACDGYVWLSGWKKHLIPCFYMYMLPYQELGLLPWLSK
jgi:hypothetical protein